MIPPEMNTDAVILAQLAANFGKKLAFWTAQNTGWSNGVSWFDLEARRGEARRFESEADARAAIAGRRLLLKDPSVKWRITHVEIEREENRRITTETFIAVD